MTRETNVVYDYRITGKLLTEKNSREKSLNHQSGPRHDNGLRNDDCY